MKGRYRRAIQRAYALILLGILSGMACGRSVPDGPSVLFIVIDTIRLDRIGCYGSTLVRTPSIDRLASEGMLFENAFSQAAYTLPSMCTMMTSLYPYRHQVRANDMDLHGQFTTMAEIFQSAGYRTGAILGSTVLAEERNLSQGFDHYDDSFPEEMTVFSGAMKKSGIALGAGLERRADEVTDRALAWVDRGRKKPFFLFLHYFDPHSQYDPPPPFQQQYQGRNYEGEVAFTDREIGRLLEGLRHDGIADDLLVVLSGDHGESLGDHGEAEHGFFVYDQTIRTPLIIKYPGRVTPGRRTSKFVRNIDILPTITELMGLEPPYPIDGRSLGAILREDEFDEVPVYSEAFSGYFHYGWSPTRSIRTLKWKYIEAPKRELYDMRGDPDETVNLYDPENPAAIRLGKIMRKHLRDESLVKQVETVMGAIGEEQKARLAALGYISSGRKMKDSFEGLPDPKEEVAKFNRRQRAKFYTHQGFLSLQAENIEKAEAEFGRAIDEMDGYLPALKGRASVRILSGSYREAELLYRRILEADSENREIYFRLAVAQNYQGRVKEAIETLESCPPDAPPYPQFEALLQGLRDAFSRGKTLTITPRL